MLSIATELERMGDYVGIGKIVLLHDGHPLLKPLVDTYLYYSRRVARMGFGPMTRLLEREGARSAVLGR